MLEDYTFGACLRASIFVLVGLSGATSVGASSGILSRPENKEDNQSKR